MRRVSDWGRDVSALCHLVGVRSLDASVMRCGGVCVVRLWDWAATGSEAGLSVYPMPAGVRGSGSPQEAPMFGAGLHKEAR